MEWPDKAASSALNAVAVNYVTNKIYVSSNNNSDTMTAMGNVGLWFGPDGMPSFPGRTVE
jgi:hypothetical protein